MILVLDIDSTIADGTHREHLLYNKKKLTKEQFDVFLNPTLV